MAPIPNYPGSPLPARRGDFSVGLEGMRIFHTVRWVASVRLRAMALTPSAYNVPAVAIEWVVGQLRYFDIPHRVVMSYDVLSETLLRAVLDGRVSICRTIVVYHRLNIQCDRFPDVYWNMKTSLVATFKQNDTAAWQSLRAFVDANPTPSDTIFNHLFSPSAEAKFDLYRFVEKHFPRETHINRPRDKKTPYAIALPTYRGGERMVERRVNDRGVRLFAGEHDYIEHTNVVGWAVNGTRALANKYDHHAFNLRFRNREAELKRLYDEHRLFCANQPAYTGLGQANELLRLEGHYILRCDKVVSIYDISNIMTLISPLHRILPMPSSH